MKTSILIPAFNAANTLEATLLSCVVQGQEIIEEIIVVDDHSDDRTQEVFDSIAQRHPELNWIWAVNPEKGACSARNHAFQLSRGDFIQWLDADDILGPKKLEVQRNILSGNGDSIVTSPFRPFRGSPATGIIVDPRNWNLARSHSPEDWLSMDPMCIPACWLMPRSCARKAGPWNESLLVNQDGEYFARVIASADQVIFDHTVEVFYRREGGGVSMFTAEKAESLFRSIESMANTALQIEDSERMRQMISNRWQQFIYTSYPHAPELLELARQKLTHLPTPNVANPNEVSKVSKAFSAIFGWKALTQARRLKSKLRRH